MLKYTMFVYTLYYIHLFILYKVWNVRCSVRNLKED